jgi:hypothetical protein
VEACDRTGSLALYVRNTVGPEDRQPHESRVVHRDAGCATARHSGSQPDPTVATSLGVTCSYTVMIGLPVYILIATALTAAMPIV